MKPVVFTATLVMLLLSGCMSSRSSLDDGWTADGVPVALPHCWNVDDGTDGPTDMKSDNRREGGRDGLNDKGLVGFDHTTTKPVYDFYRTEWN